MPRVSTGGAGTFSVSATTGPYFTGSRIPIATSGLSVPAAYAIIGPGDIHDGYFQTPLVAQRSTATIVAATPYAYALRELQIVPPPPAGVPVVAVATYYGGIALHSLNSDALLGFVTVPGAPGDVAIAKNGDFYAPATNANFAVSVTRAPWDVRTIPDIPVGNEVAIDHTTGAVFISNRDVNGKGALTRILFGRVERLETGVTAEGLALDESAHRIFVGNVNDASILEVDTESFTALRRIRSVPRTFGLALDIRHDRLFAVSNQNEQMRRGGGYVVAIDLHPASGRIVAQSRNFPFPIGAAYDARTSTVFVTDEDSESVYVLDPKTLREKHAPLHACAVPWKPHLDALRRRLYVPCARADKVAVYNVDSLRLQPGTPFATGEYPIGVATSGS